MNISFGVTDTSVTDTEASHGQRRYFILDFNCSNLILIEALSFRNPDSRAGNRQIIRKGRDIKL